MNEIFGKKLGQYVLLEQLGEGGMAKVYNAFDSRVERNVAIKVILPSKRTSKIFLQQFEREARALANLTHTNIVKVLNYGIQDGQPYLVMEYVSGGTLKEAMNQKLPWQTAAAILAPIARALDYVHQQHIVHRDVKPSNILLQEDFSPMLSDFGILQLLEGKDEKVDAAIGAGVGTPEYMPPEQGMGKEVDFRADIYSLGLVFYEMITGQKPYTADSPMAMVIRHVTDELPLPTRIDKNIPKFVERVILRAVQKNPQDRYISMGHFADALELIALGDKALERKIIKVSRQKEKRRKSISIFSLSALLVILVLGTGLFAYNYYTETNQQPASTQPAIPTTSIASATATQKNLLEIIPTSTITLAPAETATLAPSLNPFSDLTLLQTPIVKNQNFQFKEIARWGIGGVNVVKWSPDGTRIALGTTSGIFLFDSQTKDLVLFIDTQFNVVEMTFNPLEDGITAGSLTGLVKTWNSKSGEFLQNYSSTRSLSNSSDYSNAVTAISYSVDGKNIAIGYKSGIINFFPVKQGTATLTISEYPSVEDLAISADNRFIYASNGSKNINIWNIQDGKKGQTALSNSTPVSNMTLSSDRQLLLAGGNGSSVYIWDLFEGKQINTFSNPGSRVTDFDFSYDGKYVAIGLSTGAINIFETPDPKDFSKTPIPLVSVNGYSKQIQSIAFSPQQLIVASGNIEEGLKLWDALNGQNTFTLDQSMRGINKIYFSPDGLWLATAHDDGQLRIWDVNKAQEVFITDGFLPKGNPFSPDSRFLAFIHSPGKTKPDLFRIFDLAQGSVVAEFPGYLPRSFVQFTSDSKLLISGDAYKANIWDVATWELVNSHGGPTAGCGQYFTPQNDLLSVISNAGILFNSDEKIEAMCGVKPQGSTFVFYFVKQHKMLFVLGNGDLGIWTFSSDNVSDFNFATPYPLSNEIFLAGDQDSGWYAYVSAGEILLKNINGLAGIAIEGQNDYHYQVAFLPQKHLMALASKYGSIHIWTMP